MYLMMIPISLGLVILSCDLNSWRGYFYWRAYRVIRHYCVYMGAICGHQIVDHFLGINFLLSTSYMHDSQKNAYYESVAHRWFVVAIFLTFLWLVLATFASSAAVGPDGTEDVILVLIARLFNYTAIFGSSISAFVATMQVLGHLRIAAELE